MYYKKYFNQFIEELKEKMDAGHREYGDGSFGLPPEKLIKELKEEALDICGWGMILWVRLEEMLRKHEKPQP